MSSINSSPVAGEISNISAPIHPAMIESIGSIVAYEGNSGLPAFDSSQSPSIGGPLVDIAGSFSHGDVSIVR
jgi:hypothetical protein